MEYIIIHDTGIISLQNEVNRKMKEGYMPYGELVISQNGDKNTGTPIFCQVMFLTPIMECQCEDCQCKKEENEG